VLKEVLVFDGDDGLPDGGGNVGELGKRADLFFVLGRSALGQRRTTIAVRVKFDPFTALTVPATSLRKAIDRHTAKTKTVRNTVENLRKKVQTLANGEGTDILTNVLSETMVSDEPAMKAMMQRLETAVDQAMRS
jgi:hypothetical protein